MSNSGRSRVREDRFYSPPARRRYNQQHQQPEVQQEHKQVQPQQPQEKQEQSESLMHSSSSSSSNVVMTNLDRFMKHTTPIVTAQHFPKTSMKGWRRSHENYQPYFILGDLWESFKEWSAYGAGVPLVLNESDSVVQYYAPYLSAIQLYEDPAAPARGIRRLGEGSDSESSRATSSDGCYDAGAVGHEPCVPENNIDPISQSFKKLMLDESKIRTPPGLIIFEYFEHSLPYHRAPLADQVSELASRFPVLKTYRSCDLTQSSWFSVAWYPIYRIPLGPSLKNVDSCFLTFHSLSTTLRGTDEDTSRVRGSTVREVHDAGVPCRLSLPIFGLAVYKFKSSDWTRDAVHGIEKVNSLIHSTENWLRSLGVYHPDFVFFKNHSILR